MPGVMNEPAARKKPKFLGVCVILGTQEMEKTAMVKSKSAR